LKKQYHSPTFRSAATANQDIRIDEGIQNNMQPNKPHKAVIEKVKTLDF